MSSRSTRKFARLTMSDIALDWSQMVSRIPDAVRQIPARTPVTPGTVAKWLQGSTKPSADNVAILMEEFAEFADAMVERAKVRHGAFTFQEARKLKEALKVLEGK